VLEHSVSASILGTGGFLQVSGLSFKFDPKRPSGQRLVGDIRRTAGSAVLPRDSIQVALGAYSACDKGDGYDLPEAAAACRQRQSAPRAADLLIQYIADSLKGQIQVPKDSRMIQAGNTNPG
jgi:hypothetical protein